MGMNVTARDLRIIADKIEQLESLQVDVRIVRIQGHAIFVKPMSELDDDEPSDPPDGVVTGTLVIIGITDKALRPPDFIQQPAMRSNR